ncbi:MAG: cytochrome C oxidase subunit IV family protein [Fimbriimonadaceae bacterium]
MATDPHAHAGHHVIPIKTLVLTGGALIVLMVLTVGWAQIAYLILPDAPIASFINNFVAMTIAVAKALLVILIFMGVKWSTKLTKMYALCGFVWVTLIGIAFCDYATRRWEPVAAWEESAISPITGAKLPTEGAAGQVQRQHWNKPPKLP